jgi:hypothetical protein
MSRRAAHPRTVGAPSELGVSCRVKVPFGRLTATSTRGGRAGSAG